jgi:DinB superfamily
MATPSELAEQYLAGAAVLRQAVNGMTREQLVARPVAGKWSSLEVVCHIADFEPIFADRAKRIFALGDTPLLLAADENLYAKAFNYHDRDIEEQLAVVEATRRDLARIVRSLKPDQLQLTGCHNKKGIVTLEQVIKTATGHIAHHAPFIAEKRKALGV